MWYEQILLCPKMDSHSEQCEHRKYPESMKIEKSTIELNILIEKFHTSLPSASPTHFDAIAAAIKGTM